MQSTLRTKIAAAALALLPVGALVAAQPAAAQDRGRHDDRGHTQRHVRDYRAPAIFGVTPSQGDRVSERGRTQISARYSDDRSGVDPRSVTLRVNGRDVTRQARVDGNDIRYAENLRPGRHFAELVVKDRAGNTSRRSWSFNVMDDQRYGWGYGRR